MKYDNREKTERDRMMRDTAALVGTALTMLGLGVVAVLLFRWEGMVAVIAGSLLCAALIIATPRFRQNPMPIAHVGRQ